MRVEAAYEKWGTIIRSIGEFYEKLPVEVERKLKECEAVMRKIRDGNTDLIDQAKRILNELTVIIKKN